MHQVLINNNVNILTVHKRLGHEKEVETTLNIYAHLFRGVPMIL